MVDLSKFKKLNDQEHILLRPERYLGNIHPEVSMEWFIKDNKIQYEEISYSPAFIKCFDEILTNSIDHAKRPEGKHLDTIKISINKMFNTICVEDNGGIMVVQHPEYDNLWLPDMLFGYLKSGSNFTDDDIETGGAGNFGEGSSLVNVFSKSFKVETADNKKLFSIEYTDNMSTKTDPIIKKSSSNFTRITYQPDLERFGMDCIDEDIFKMLERRVVVASILNQNIKFIFNGKEIKYSGFEDFAKMGDSVAFFEREHLQVGIAKSEDAFQHFSFVNGGLTKNGGTHVDYITNQIVSSIREYIKKKTKIDVRPSDLKNRLTIFINCNVIIKRYNSQTKDCLVTPYSEIGYSFDLDEKFLKKIIKSEVCQAIIDWAEHKQEQLENKELEKANKELAKGSLRDIPKFEDANEKRDRKKCSLFVTEGDSAFKPILATREPKYQGIFALRGVPLNCFGRSLIRIKENEEISNLAKIIGAEFGKKIDLNSVRYGKIIIATDADQDGANIRSMTISNLYLLWPELVESGMIYFLKTPIIRVLQGKKDIDFMQEEDFLEWESKQTKKNYTVDYLKGLGSSNATYFKKYLHDDKYLEQLLWNKEIDYSHLDLAFNPKNADKRKVWLGEGSHGI